MKIQVLALLIILVPIYILRLSIRLVLKINNTKMEEYKMIIKIGEEDLKSIILDKDWTRLQLHEELISRFNKKY